MDGVGFLGAIVLAGFHALPWGHFGYGPTAPSLSILVEQEMVDKIIFEDIADDFFRLDDAAPAHYRQNGELRPAVLVALACQVMYYAERRAASEVPQVLRRLEVAVRSVHLKHNQQVNAVDVLETWGTHVKIQFDNKNMPLTMRHAEPHDTKVRSHRVAAASKAVRNVAMGRSAVGRSHYGAKWRGVIHAWRNRCNEACRPDFLAF